jgi:hypothetical protein
MDPAAAAWSRPVRRPAMRHGPLPRLGGFKFRSAWCIVTLPAAAVLDPSPGKSDSDPTRIRLGSDSAAHARRASESRGCMGAPGRGPPPGAWLPAGARKRTPTHPYAPSLSARPCRLYSDHPTPSPPSPPPTLADFHSPIPRAPAPPKNIPPIPKPRPLPTAASSATRKSGGGRPGQRRPARPAPSGPAGHPMICISPPPAAG